MPLIPGDSDGSILITTRVPGWRELVEAVPVTPFTRVESLEFITKCAYRLEPHDADRLAENLGDLPLALAQGTALLAETGMSLAQFMRLLADAPGRLLDEGTLTAFPLSMTAAWRLTADSVRNRTPEAMNLLKCLAFFPPEPIPLRILRNGIPDSEPLADVLNDPISLGRTIRNIALFGATDVDPIRDTIQVHRLIQALIRDSLAEDERTVFRHQADLLSAATSSQKSKKGTEWFLMSIYIPFDRLYAAEQRRVLTLFRDWLARTRKHGIRQVRAEHFTRSDV